MPSPDNEHIDILEILAEAMSAPNTLAEGLDQIMRLTCRMMDTEQTAYLQIDEEKQDFLVMAMAGLNADNLKIGQALKLPERLHAILWRIQNTHQINWIESGIANLVFPIIVMPIFYKGKRIGLLITGGSRDEAKSKDPMRRKMFNLLGPFVSLIIENAKATDLLSQHFAMNSKELLNSLAGQKEQPAQGENAAVAEKLMVDTISNPLKVIRLLSESFYRELSEAGFNKAQIAVAAAQLLECITRD